jgi:hypothetical protein
MSFTNEFMNASKFACIAVSVTGCFRPGMCRQYKKKERRILLSKPRCMGGEAIYYKISNKK